MEERTITIAEEGKTKRVVHTVWVGEEDRVVSFHPVDTYKPQSFENREFFFGYLHTLQTRGFRFQ